MQKGKGTSLYMGADMIEALEKFSTDKKMSKSDAVDMILRVFFALKKDELKNALARVSSYDIEDIISDRD